MTTTLSDVIAMLEKATGPDREIDYAIDRAVTGRAKHRLFTPPYCSSVDAALTLLHAEYGAVSMSKNEHGQSSAHVGHPYMFGNGQTIAIAICIAALKARLSLAKEGGV